MDEHEKRCQEVMHKLQELPDSDLDALLDPSNIKQLIEFLNARAARKLILSSWYKALTIIAAALLAIDLLWSKIAAFVKGAIQ